MMPLSLRCRCFCPLVALLLLASPSLGEEKEFPLESADNSSPQATLNSFLQQMHQAVSQGPIARTYQNEAKRKLRRDRILRSLDLSQLAPAMRENLSKEAGACLKEVLDRIELPPESEWPDAEEMAEKELTKWTIPRTEITIIKMEEGPREGEFLFSADTVERSKNYYQLIKHQKYIDRETTTPGFYEKFVSTPGWMISPRWLPSWSYHRWQGHAVWQWLGLILVLLLAMVVMASIYAVGRRNTHRLKSNLAHYLGTLLFPIAALLVPLAAEYFVVEQLNIYGQLGVTISFALNIISLFALTILVVSIGNRLAEVMIATPWIQPAGIDAQLVRLTCHALSITGAAIVLLEGGHQLGIPLTTLMAGASVSGLAIALAAQDTLKNIMGSLMIMLDKPFRIGERIVAKGYDGVVEDIGLRSTRLRLLTGHQVSIPNEEMARAEIENIGRRPYIRRSATIELPSNVPAVKIKKALEILRNLLKDHEGMEQDFPPRVYLRDVNDSSIGICMIYWYHPPDYWDFLAFSEQVTLQMSEQFEAEEIPFATPRLTVQFPPAESEQD